MHTKLEDQSRQSLSLSRMRRGGTVKTERQYDVKAVQRLRGVTAAGSSVFDLSQQQQNEVMAKCPSAEAGTNQIIGNLFPEAPLAYFP